jgi:spoIIIJ-associated protein
MTDTASPHTASPAASSEDDLVEEKDAPSLLVQEGDIAADYLERLLDIVDYDGDIDLDVENGRAMVAIVGSDLQPLIGPAGATLDALQELTRLAVQQQTGVRSRLMLDVSGHRRARRDELTGLAKRTAEEVLGSGEAVRLAPMNPFERKVVHDAISATDGVVSESEGEEPNRRVVVLPAT